jgi:hypothetical protein
LAQIKRRQELVSATRLFNGVNGTPRIVAVVPLSEDVSARDAVRSLADALDVDSSDCPDVGQWRLKCVMVLLHDYIFSNSLPTEPIDLKPPSSSFSYRTDPISPPSTPFKPQTMSSSRFPQ